MTPDQTRKAHTVVAWLVKHEPGREHAKTDGWEVAVTNRIRAERWPEVCAAVEANPDLSASTIAERLTDHAPAPTPTESPAAALPTYTAEPWKPAPLSVRQAAKERIAEIRQTLSKQTADG